MSKKIIIAEKPSVGRNIGRVLKCHKKGNGYLEGKDYIVTWALGHLIELAPPENYNKKYKSWNIDELPIIPKNFKLQVIRKSSKQYNTVKKLLGRKDIKEVIIATDAGREGELVARFILEKSHCKKTIKRLWISSVTDKAIKDGFANLRDGRKYDNLYYSALARAEADWIVGINATRALTTKYNAQLSCGRVQTPTLNLISTREKEIENFVPKIFHEVRASLGGNPYLWKDKKTGNSRIFSEDKLRSKLDNIRKANQGKVISVNKRIKTTPPPQLYDLTELQRDANRLFDFSAKETLSIMQSLYENHKILTYPRTDSKFLTTDIIETLPERLNAIKVSEYSSYINQIKTPIKTNKHFVNNSKVSDHHAIIPTEERVFLSNLSSRERKIFDLVAKRFLSSLFPPYRYEQITVKVDVNNELFETTTKHIISLGWKSIYEERSEISSSLPSYNKGDFINIKDVKSIKGETTPPALFNEGTLISAMENPAKYMKKREDKLAKVLGETGGLGTVATRADIIEELFNNFYMEKKGKDIVTTNKGRQLLNLVPEELKSPDLTATWELKLEKIKNRQLSKDEFLKESKYYTRRIIKEIKEDTAKFVHDNITGERCPECGKHMLEQKDRNGVLLICIDRECAMRKRISKVTNARCPECRKRLILKGQGDGQIFTCKCGFREKLSAFNKRKDRTNKGISKKEARKYLKKNDKNQPEVNTALADALSKLKL